LCLLCISFIASFVWFNWFKAFRKSRSFWEFSEYFGESLVIVGVIAEYIVEFFSDKKYEYVLVLGSEDNKSFPVLPKVHDDRRRLWSKRATLILALGLIIGLVGIVKTNQLSHEEIAQLENETAQIKLRSERLRMDIASAERIAAEASKAAEDERIARVRLEEHLADRALSMEQEIALTNKLREYSPQNLDIVEMIDDPEVVRFALEIRYLATAAGWNVKVFGRPSNLSKPPADGNAVLNAQALDTLSGIAISRYEGSDKKSDLACKEIDMALVIAGFNCRYLSSDGPWVDPRIATTNPSKSPATLPIKSWSFMWPAALSLRQTEKQYAESYREPKKKTTIEIRIFQKG
jgi:hypothetical protein